MRRLSICCLLLTSCWDWDYSRRSGYSGGSSELVLGWELREGGESGPLVGCAPGDVVRVESYDRDFGETYVDRFACQDGRGRTQSLPGATDYTITIALEDAAGAVRSTTALARRLPSFSTLDLGTVTFVVEAAPGSLVVQPLFGRADGTAAACGVSAAPGVVHRLEWTLETAAGELVAASRPIGAGACADAGGDPCLEQMDFGAQPAGRYRLVALALDAECRTCWPRQAFLLDHRPGDGPEVVTLALAASCR